MRDQRRVNLRTLSLFGFVIFVIIGKEFLFYVRTRSEYRKKFSRTNVFRTSLLFSQTCLGKFYCFIKTRANVFHVRRLIARNVIEMSAYTIANTGIIGETIVAVTWYARVATLRDRRDVSSLFLSIYSRIVDPLRCAPKCLTFEIFGPVFSF